MDLFWDILVVFAVFISFYEFWRGKDMSPFFS